MFLSTGVKFLPSTGYFVWRNSSIVRCARSGAGFGGATSAVAFVTAQLVVVFVVALLAVGLGVVQPTMKKAVSEISARDRRGRSLGFMLNSIDRQFMTNQQSRVKVDHFPRKADRKSTRLNSSHLVI